MSDMEVLRLGVAALVTILVAAIAAKVGQIVERNKWHQRLAEMSGLSRTQQSAPNAGDERLERLENAVDSIAVELERIGEGQRFVTKLMADRQTLRTSRSPQPGSVPGIRTPTA